jgi:hypothetical protein
LPVLVGRLLRLGEAFSVVSVTRPAAAAAESLRQRHRMSLAAAQRIAWLYEGARRAQLAWLSTLPARPALELDYDGVVENREGTVAKLAHFLEIEPTAAAVNFLDPHLRHA